MKKLTILELKALIREIIAEQMAKGNGLVTPVVSQEAPSDADKKQEESK